MRRCSACLWRAASGSMARSSESGPSADLPRQVHLRQAVGLDGAGHLGVDHLDGCQRRHARHGQSAGVGHLDGVLYQAAFLVEGGGGVEGHVGEQQQAAGRGQVHHHHVRHHAARAQSALLVEHAAQERPRVDYPLHVHVGVATAHHGHGAQGGRVVVGLVDDGHARYVDAFGRCHATDGFGVAHKDGFGYAHAAGVADGLEHWPVLCAGHGQAFAMRGSGLTHYLFEIG